MSGSDVREITSLNGREPVTLLARSVLVGEGLAPVSPATVVVERGRIVAVGESIRPVAAPTVDLGDMTLLPGFIDAHVHIGFFDPGEVVRGGVTTVRDLGWPPQEIHPLAVASRRRRDYPLVVAAGPMLTAPGGYPTRAAWAPPGTGREVSGAAEAEAAVDATVAEGAAWIKVALNPPVGPTLDLDTLAAIVREAHARSRRVTAHVTGLAELEKALEAGIDELAHMLMSPEPIPEHLIETMVHNRVVVVPTIAIRSGNDRHVAIANLERFLAAGGVAIYGTDLGNAGPRPGIDPGEVQALARAGMTPRDVIASATVTAARWLSLDRKGIIEPDMDADLIGVDGDPLEDPSVLLRPRFVMREGTRVV